MFWVWAKEMNTNTLVTWCSMDEESEISTTLAIWFTSDYEVDIFVNCVWCLGNANCKRITAETSSCSEEENIYLNIQQRPHLAWSDGYLYSKMVRVILMSF